MRNRSLNASEDLEWLMETLWPGGARIRRGASDGYVFTVVPSASRARFLLPAGEPSAALAALLLYNRLRSRQTRAARRAVAWAVKSGISQLLFRDYVEVPRESDDLWAALTEIFGRDDLVFAVGLPPRGPNRKPVLQVFTRGGVAIGYVKVGWNDLTRNRVARESTALERWRGRSGRVVRVPELLHEGTFRHLRLSVTAPLPPDASSYRTPRPPLAALRDVISLGSRSEGPLPESPFFKSLRTRVEALASFDEVRSNELRALLDRIGDGGRPVPLGPWHGDWVPWNLASAQENIYVFDWEHWGEGSPVGLDVIHWHFQVAFVLGQKDVREALAGAMAGTRTDSISLGVDPDALGTMVMLYLAEITARAYEGVAAGAPPNPRFHDPVRTLVRAGIAGRLDV